MRYYIVEQDKEYKRAPRLKNWFGKIQVKHIHSGSYELLEKDYVLPIESSESTDYADFLTEPFCMVSNMVKYVLEHYEPNLTFTDVYLMDVKYQKTYEYYIPHLLESNCLTEKSQIGFNRTKLLKAEIDLMMLGDHSIFYLGGLNKKHIVIRGDLAESLLRRGFQGTNFQIIDTINEEVWMRQEEM